LEKESTPSRRADFVPSAGRLRGASIFMMGGSVRSVRGAVLHQLFFTLPP
jgi:hypothetical protein